MAKTITLVIAVASMLGICTAFAWVLCFEDTMFGGYMPFVMLSFIGPIGCFAMGVVAGSD